MKRVVVELLTLQSWRHQPVNKLQGPPGTGKTSSTIGIISALLAKAAPDELLDDDAALLDAEMPAVQVLLIKLVM